MPVQVVLPRLGFSMQEGTITQWLVADGAKIAQGAPLYALESEKSVQEIEAPASGTLRTLKAAGATCEVGTVIAQIE